MSLNVSKACPKSSIPPKMLKDYCHLFSLKLNIDFNFCIEHAIFPNNLKLADISPIQFVQIRPIIDLLAYYLQSPKSLKDYSMNR